MGTIACLNCLSWVKRKAARVAREKAKRKDHVGLPDDASEKLPASSIANARAEELAENLLHILVGSNRPIVNPDSLLIESRLSPQEKPATPRISASDVLRAKPVAGYKGKIFLFTRAQDNTPVHEPFLKNMEAYAKERGAEIIVGASFSGGWAELSASKQPFDARIEKYLCFGRLDIGPNFFFASELNIQQTAAKPIADLVAYSQGKWAVVPHSKQDLVSIPTLDPKKLVSQILSTGSVTIPKVPPRKTGLKSIFHHIMGFVVVEFDMEGRIFARHVNADTDGSFYDLNYFVAKGRVRASKDRPDYIMLADIHNGCLDLANPRDVSASFGLKNEPNNLITTLNPRRLILQDLHDGVTDSHYSQNDLGAAVENISCRKHRLEDELLADATFLASLIAAHPSLQKIIVCESNHDLRLERYIREGRYRTDGFNVQLGLKLESAYLAHRQKCGEVRLKAKPRPKLSLHEYALRSLGRQDLRKVTWVYDGESRILNGVEVGHHGFRGTNGSKASIATYTRIGKKISFGDKHSAAILEGAYQGGVMSLRQNYNLGPSSWSVSHILQYKNGKRCIISMNNGAWHYEKGK